MVTRPILIVTMALTVVALAAKPAPAQDEDVWATTETTAAAADNSDLGIYKDADTDGSDNLSKKEFVAFFEKRFEQADKNGDGALDAEELKAARLMPGSQGAGEASGSAPAPGAMLMRLDRNGDGRVTSEELPEQLRDRLMKLDRNGDGAIEKDELPTNLPAGAAARMGQGRGAGPQGAAGARAGRRGAGRGGQ